MDIDESEELQTTSIKPDDRIKELLQVDHDISACLKKASKVLTILANQDSPDLNYTTVEEAQNELAQTSSSFFETLSSIEVRLRRQAYALEEAGLIQPGTRADASNAGRLIDEGASKGGGGGPLDSSWLNARAEDKVGMGIKRESLDKMLNFLESAGIDIKKIESATDGQ